jgi:S1-C subfamily serine protease
MSKLSNILAFLLRAIVTGLALAFVIVYLFPSALNNREGAVEVTPPPPPAPASYAEAVNRAGPSVVSIYTRAYLAPIRGHDTSFLNRMRLRVIADEGSGVILRDDGYIITNLHVINLVSDIRIALWDGRIVPARVVGTDPVTDLAVLKIDLEGLPVATVRDGSVNVGDVVLAIGNSVGLSHTVTMGIVSATGRNVDPSPLYEDFIQTDAAINAGNSGGALVDTDGRLMGINTRVADDRRGVQNIGFAIPIELALDVMNQIIEYGSVRRGWLGADYSNLRPSALPDGSAIQIGVGIRDVRRDSPAWTAGIRPGDYILSLDGDPVSDAARFQLAISQRVPGTRIELVVQRGRETFQTYATLIQQPPL